MSLSVRARGAGGVPQAIEMPFFSRNGVFVASNIVTGPQARYGGVLRLPVEALGADGVVAVGYAAVVALALVQRDEEQLAAPVGQCERAGLEGRAALGREPAYGGECVFQRT